MPFTFPTSTDAGLDIEADGAQVLISRDVEITDPAQGFSAAAVELIGTTDVSVLNYGTLNGQVAGIETTEGSIRSTITNYRGAEITGAQFGASLLGRFETLQNYGAMSGGETGVLAFGENSTIENIGTIEGGFEGIRDSGLDNSVVNYGTVSGSRGIVSDGIDLSVVNHGVIKGERGGVIFDEFSDGGRIENYGRIETNSDFAIAGNDTVQTVVNYGHIAGGIGLGGGNDVYDARGVGTVDGLIRGGFGNDHIIGGRGVDNVDGGVGKDTIITGGGNDVIDASFGNDFVNAGRGNDTIIGGAGRDTLIGGAGDDTFVFQIANDSDIMRRDIIRDFEQGADRLDISGIAETGDFTLVENYSVSGQAEVRFKALANGNTIVFIDKDGDGQTDSAIELRGVIPLTADDFIL